MATFILLPIALACVGAALTINRERPVELTHGRQNHVPMLSIIFAFGFVGLLVYKVVIYPKYLSPLRKLPGPQGGSIWNGQTSKMLRAPNGRMSTLWCRTIPNNGLIRYLGLLNAETLIVTSAEGLAELATRTDDFPKPKFLSDLAGAILGPGLILVNGAEHRRQRKMLAPAFTAKHVKDLYPIFWQKSYELIEGLIQARSDDREKGTVRICVDISDWVARASLDVITLAALGEDSHAISNPDTPLCKSYHDVLKLGPTATLLAMVKSYLPAGLVERLPFAKNLALNGAADTIHQTCRQIVRKKQGQLAQGKLSDTDLLSVLLRDRQISEDEAVHQMMSFLAAGHETGATTLTYAIYMLCVYPEWQTKLRDEVRASISAPNMDDDISSFDVDQLTLVNAFCMETLRYWPPVPTILRTTARDTTLLGEPIPKDTLILLPIRAVNRDPGMWGESAQEFRPDRWVHEEGHLDASGGAESKYGMMTFSHGTRNCIGQSFGKGEMASLLAALIGRFEFELKNKEELIESNLKTTRGGLTAKPLNGLWVYLREIDGW